jgi:hypothetical protein
MVEDGGGASTPPHEGMTPSLQQSPSAVASSFPASSFVYPGMISSTVLPIVSPPTKKIKVEPPTPAAVAAADPQLEDDVVCAFGNKTFHYLDPFQPLSVNDFTRQSVTSAAYVPLSMSQQQQQQEASNLFVGEAETFFQDFDFPDHIGSEIENDAIFGDMLETLIS